VAGPRRRRGRRRERQRTTGLRWSQQQQQQHCTRRKKGKKVASSCSSFDVTARGSHRCFPFPPKGARLRISSCGGRQRARCEDGDISVPRASGGEYWGEGGGGRGEDDDISTTSSRCSLDIDLNVEVVFFVLVFFSLTTFTVFTVAAVTAITVVVTAIDWGSGIGGWRYGGIRCDGWLQYSGWWWYDDG
jgi:hypothetical protein